MQSPNSYTELEKSMISTKSWRTTSYIIQQLKRLPGRDSGLSDFPFFFPTFSGQHSTISWEKYSGTWGGMAIPVYTPKIVFSQLTPLCLAFSFQDSSSQNWPTNAFKEGVLLNNILICFFLGAMPSVFSLLGFLLPPRSVIPLHSPLNWRKDLSRF